MRTKNSKQEVIKKEETSSMKTELKFIKIEGVETPSFNEPKGEAYEKAMRVITQKVEAKRSIKNNSEDTRARLKGELNAITSTMMMEDDDFELAALRIRKKEIQEKLEDVVDYSDFSVEAYAKKLISSPEVQNMKREADEEIAKILSTARAYDKALSDLYNSIKWQYRGFLSASGKGSDSATRRANVNYNEYDNA